MLTTRWSQLQQQDKTRQSLWPPCSRKTRTHRSFPLAAEKWSSVQPLASRILGEYPCSSILLTVQTSPAATAAWICSSSWSSGFLLQWWFSILSHFRKGMFICVWGEVSASPAKGWQSVSYDIKMFKIVHVSYTEHFLMIEPWWALWKKAVDSHTLTVLEKQLFSQTRKSSSSSSSSKRSQIPVITSSIVFIPLKTLKV